MCRLRTLLKDDAARSRDSEEIRAAEALQFSQLPSTCYLPAQNHNELALEKPSNHASSRFSLKNRWSPV